MTTGISESYRYKGDTCNRLVDHTSDYSNKQPICGRDNSISSVDYIEHLSDLVQYTETGHDTRHYLLLTLQV